MTLLRPVLLRTVSALVLSLTLAACGSAGATTQPLGTPGASNPTAAAATVAPPAATTAAAATTAPTAAQTATAAGGVPDCSGGQIGRKAFTMDGFQAQRYCGPATATVTVSGTTVTITSGWCETNAAGFAVSIGTQLFGSPSASQEPDLFLVLVDPTTGDGPISGVADHHHFLLTSPPLSFGAGKQSGTFSGTGIVGGAISGHFTCG